ncbi:MAG TPA: glycosyltransferase family 4 protein [Gemmatimonadota bacterium]|nr:glycosyltransferase family 4 protein [Gemmatimonadota bacterium]
MKILILNDVAATVGGAETLTLDLRDELRRRGHDARVFASDALTRGGESPADYGCYGTTGKLRTVNRVANPQAWLSLRSAMAEFQPDVVHVRMFMTQLSPLVLPLLEGVPSLYHAAWYETICPIGTRLLPDDSICEFEAGRVCLEQGCLSRRAWVALMAQRFLWERWRDVFALVVANSAAMERRLNEHGIGPTLVIWNGVPRRSPRRPLSRPPVVAYAGRLTHEKGVGVLMRAYAEARRAVPEARLLMVGDGPERSGLRRLARELGVEAGIRWTGHLSREAMERELESAWVQAVPSILEEPFGLVAAEAMMRGTAVLAAGHGGLSEIVQPGETGMLVMPNDAPALATALAALLSDRERCEAMGRAGHEWAWERLSRETCAESFLGAYRRIREEGAA